VLLFRLTVSGVDGQPPAVVGTHTTIPLGRRRRPPLARGERAALSVVGVAVAGFGVHGVVHEVPGTFGYVLTVSGLATVLFTLRTKVLPAPIALAAAASAVVHLAGGLVQVGDDVLYNASPGPELLRYDHFGHALGLFVAALLVWEVLVRDAFAVSGRRSLVAVTMLAALGLGALNEAVEFVATLAQGESHVGGYTNTGWDLVTNTFAGLLAAVVIHRRRRDVDGQDDVTTGRDPAAGRAGVDVTLVG
jgi:Predicted membrane protein (DUF2238)